MTLPIGLHSTEVHLVYYFAEELLKNGSNARSLANCHSYQYILCSVGFIVPAGLEMLPSAHSPSIVQLQQLQHQHQPLSYMHPAADQVHHQMIGKKQADYHSFIK